MQNMTFYGSQDDAAAKKNQSVNVYMNPVFDTIIGESKAIREVKELAQRASGFKYSVLILGPSGTGKELVAKAIHDASRPDRPFIAINCAETNRDLLRSELFGYEGGAFTGAKKGGQSGKIIAADTGTLFLDEIGEMPLDMQAMLLRVLETRTVTPIGGIHEQKVDVRFIAATNHDIVNDVILHNFRDDLFYRLNIVKIITPKLTERMEDLPLLIRHFLNQIVNENNLESITIDHTALESLYNYSWPGNVRQLKNALESASVNAINNVITLESLPAVIRDNINYCKQPEGKLKNHEQQYIKSILQKHHNNVASAARELGISRTTLYARIREFRSYPNTH